MQYVLGIDGGGSRTRCLAASLEGEVLGEGEGGPANLVTLPAREVRASLEEAIHGALIRAGLSTTARCTALCAGLAGAASGQGRPAAIQALGEITGTPRVELTTDLHIALAGALPPGPGILVAAGTGSAALGRDGQGRILRAGGFGHLLGDEGSGCWIAKEAIKALLRAAEGRGEPTTLADYLDPARCEESWPLHCRQAAPADLAALFPRVVQAAQAGDGPARSILEWAGRELADLAASLARRLDRTGATPLSWTGGILPNSPITAAVFSSQAADLDLLPAEPLAEPVVGALQLAREIAKKGDRT